MSSPLLTMIEILVFVRTNFCKQIRRYVQTCWVWSVFKWNKRIIITFQILQRYLIQAVTFLQKSGSSKKKDTVNEYSSYSESCKRIRKKKLRHEQDNTCKMLKIMKSGEMFFSVNTVHMVILFIKLLSLYRFYLVFKLKVIQGFLVIWL